MGRGGIVQDVASHLTAQFSERLHEKLTRRGPEGDADTGAQTPPDAIAGTRVARIVVLSWIRRTLAREGLERIRP